MFENEHERHAKPSVEEEQTKHTIDRRDRPSGGGGSKIFDNLVVAAASTTTADRQSEEASSSSATTFERNRRSRGKKRSRDFIEASNSDSDSLRDKHHHRIVATKNVVAASADRRGIVDKFRRRGDIDDDESDDNSNDRVSDDGDDYNHRLSFRRRFDERPKEETSTPPQSKLSIIARTSKNIATDTSTATNNTTATTSATVSMLDVWNSFSIGRWEQSSTSRRETLSRFRRTQLKACDVLAVCQNVYDTYADACWSLVGRIDADTCAATFKIPERKIDVLRNMFRRLFAGLDSMQRACRRFGVESRFRFDSSENDTTSTSSVTATTKNDDDDVVDHRQPAIERKDTDDCDVTDGRQSSELLDIIQDVDEYLYSLCRIALVRTNDKRALSDMEDPNNFASINHVMSDEHMNYLCSRIEYTGRYVPKNTNGGGGSSLTDTNKNNVRHTLRGMFLVSLREGQAANGKFATWLDANDNLQKIVTRFVNRYFVPNASDDSSVVTSNAATTVNGKTNDKFRVFVNISMKMNAQHFHVIKHQSIATNKPDVATTSSSSSDKSSTQSSVLALVQLAFVTYDAVKNIMAAKAYVVHTFSPM